MLETAAHLVDQVFPRVPVRQWVLSFPWPLRLLFAARPDVLTRVLNVVTRARSTAVLKGAGLSRSTGAQTGIVTAIARFGSALNLNVHLHLLVLDGGYTFAHDRARFHRAPAPSQAELQRVLDTLIARITRTLVAASGILPRAAFVLPCTSRAGVLVEDADNLGLTWSQGGALKQLSAAAVRYRITGGPLAGRKTMTLHSASAVARDGVAVKALTAARDGFSLNAAVACEDHQREKLERLCRYVCRGPIALERLSVDGDGLVVYALKHPFADGTTHVLFEPLDFIARLAALDCRDAGGTTPWMGEVELSLERKSRATQEQLPRCRARACICCAITVCSPRMPNIAITSSPDLRPRRLALTTPLRPSPAPR